MKSANKFHLLTNFT